ncbi:NAD(+)/NADH kinase [Myxococcota bacterium]|nr:NAD(+)/NADH kinase [Myxococcota bacterium]
MSNQSASTLDEAPEARPLGIVINPASGRDTRRLFARAGTSSPQDKRNQVERILVGAAAAGTRRAVLVRDPFRIADAAVSALGVKIEIDLQDIHASANPRDTATAVHRMREAGCGALVILGGDGTSRLVTQQWPDAPMLPLSTGTNNVFPWMIEATVAGAAAGVVAGGGVPIMAAAQRAKVVRVEIEGEPDDVALIDAVHMVGDSTGNLLPFEPDLMRTLVLARAEPAAVGLSPIGGLLQPCSREDDFGVAVQISPEGKNQNLLAPISPGLYRSVPVREARRLALGERVEIRGPGLLAFDGDRERALRPDQPAWLRVERNGPWVIDPSRALLQAAKRGVYQGRTHWHDHRDDAGGVDCC